MKEAIGGLSIFQLVIIFLLIFVAIMCLTLNHSKAFGVKDEVINILENNSLANYSSANIITDETKTSIISALDEVGYRTTGSCPSGYTGYNKYGQKTESKNQALFCLKVIDVTESYYADASSKCSNNKCITTDEFPVVVYYDIVLFYQLDVPIIKTMLDFKVYGSTKALFG